MAQITFWVVQSDEARAKRWEALLRREGWQVQLEAAFERFAAAAPATRLGMALVDHELLRPTATEALKRLKASAPGVSLILTSGPLTPDKVIAALEAGADDHLPHHIDDRLFLAKLKTHLRRLLPSLATALDVLESPGGEVRLDRSRHEAWIKGLRGKWLPLPQLTPTEFQFLTLFLEQPGKVLERGFIVETLWQAQGDQIQPGTVDKHIESLRKKLGRFGSMIRTVYGVGYSFRALTGAGSGG